MRPGGAAFVIDNDASRSTFGRWFRRSWPSYDAKAVERFWTRQGWERDRLDIRWDFDSREDFEAVVGIEFDPDNAELILAEHPDATGVDYAVNLWHRRYSYLTHGGSGKRTRLFPRPVGVGKWALDWRVGSVDEVERDVDDG